MIKKIYQVCCSCRSFQFMWFSYHNVLEELKDSFLSLFASCETSRGRSAMKICRGSQSFFLFALTVPLQQLFEHCWRIGSGDRKWGWGSLK